MSRRKEDALAAGIPIRGTKHSMKRRKPWHDYHAKGLYMLTLVVAGRKPLLGRLVTHIPEVETSGVEAAPAPTPAIASTPAIAPTPAVSTAGTPIVSPAVPPAASRITAEVALSPLGQAIRDEEIKKINAHYKMVEVWKLCIMPDHIHMIVRVTEDMPEGKHLGFVIRGFMAGCTKAWWRITASTPAAPTPATAPTPAVSTAGTPTAGTPTVSTPPSRPSLFESGYNDQILLHEGQLDNWKRYLDDNPRRLAVKRLHPDLFTTLHAVDLADWHCQTVGNRFLLDIPQKVAVIVHGAYTDKDYATYKAAWLTCGEAGGVLVSAAIAPREKAVMREAMDLGYRVILVRENGFPPLYKPVGESFDACYDGRLLQVSPWAYHPQRRVISREQCLMLNRLVEYIANQ